MTQTTVQALDIAAVERETGLSKDVLRKWEVRYGFPVPQRDSQGDRAYPLPQVSRLRLIKRLMDTGMRPARLVAAAEEELLALTRARQAIRPGNSGGEFGAACFAALRRQDPLGLRQLLQRELLTKGAERFVLDIMAPLNGVVGEAWARGDLGVHQEHLYAEVVQGMLRGVIANLGQPAAAPRVLLTTVPGELHGLGILMVETLLSLHGATCISLGTQTPIEEITRAVLDHQVDVLALSFSSAYPRRRIVPNLMELQRRIGDVCEIWAGGAGTLRLPAAVPGPRLLATLEAGLEALCAWRAARAAGGVPS